ncbi:zinc-binding alcohol dehydrogenase [Rubrobacter taiwanensis]|jgi:threonine dehydrogenase-like Zn-dependent dehydrogenase|uniref:Zinc-binding alcohol dehydrogenase n=1 Tax=Rubrobacter taiwanensis TaxID=185139 RepID=A0A4R1BLH5_9ACTN|nr:zinc-binding dehydrogenase [Rubrobacter taiwanensis]TCJ18280.1 zinc-binding alcohol dehydrogenase [Rubrobacter taiwanensis]
MQALRYRKSIPRYLLMRLAAKRVRGLDTSSAAPFGLEEIPEPVPPTPEWVRVRPRLAGICGSDLSTLSATSSPYFSPLTSPPFVMGHEVVGEVAEDAGDFRAGDRVVIEPALGCRVRGISPECPMCSAGRYALCTNVTEGDISPGIQTGFCRDTGGGWSEMLVAHPSQLYRVPETLSDEEAVLTEPLACAVHAALTHAPDPEETVVVLGAGSIGLLVVGALKQLTGVERLICVAKHPRQRQEALRLGASAVVSPKEVYTRLPELLGARLHRPELGKPVVLGGADKVFECIGSPGTLEDATRLARPGGTVAFVGMPGHSSRLDLTPLWHQETELVGTYAYGIDEYRGERVKSFELALRIAPALDLKGLVGPRFRLPQYREAIAAARAAGRNGHVKVAFDLREE